MNAKDVKVNDIEAVIARHPGVRGLRQLRQTLDLVDGGAESPYESLTRLLLVQAGFPRPQPQIPVLDEYGFVIARIDWGHLPLAGDSGPIKQRSWDVERYAKLPELGWIDVRLTSGMLHNSPQVFLDRVGAALLSRGCPKTWSSPRALANRARECADPFANTGESRTKPRSRWRPFCH